MTQEHIKQLEKELWDAADQLRANSKLTAAEYKGPILGLILLRFAQNRYEEAKEAVKASIPEGPRGKRVRSITDIRGTEVILHREGLGSGIYLVQLQNSNGLVYTDKLLVE